jgi:hypothetical protein
MSVKPISPEEIEELIEPLPDEVIEIFNDEIKYGWREGEARMQRQNVKFRISQRLEIEESEVEEQGLLNIERIGAAYSDGWQVTEERPNCWTDIVFRKAR